MKTAHPAVFARLSLFSIGYYVIAVAALHVLEPTYDPTSTFISDYVNGQYPLLTAATFVALAVALAGLAMVVRARLSRTRLATIGRGFLWVGVGGVLAAGLFPAGLVAFPALSVALVSLSRVASRIAVWQLVSTRLLVVAILFVVTFVAIMGWLFELGWGGAGQRLLFVWLFAWIIIAVRHGAQLEGAADGES